MLGYSANQSQLESYLLMRTVRILMALMLCAGLLLCLLSDFPTTRQFAVYFALALTAAVTSDLTLLPLLLGWRKTPNHMANNRPPS